MANTNATTHTVEDVTDFSGSGTVLYTGRLVDNKRDGRGVCWWPTTGEQYDGEWQQGQKDGWGQWRGPDGETFEGLHRGGRWARGRCLSTDGTLRDGSWVQVRTGAGHSYQMQGWGVQRRIVRASTTTTTTTGADSPAATRAMETVYEGEWDRHEWHGRGIWRSPRGTGDVYDGEFDHGKRSGYGRMMFGEHSQGGGIYVGGWKDDVFHGRGVRIWDDGTRYEGDWVCGKMHGAGKKWERDGTVIEGVWENGVIKSGKVTWPNGDEFAGRFSDDGVGEGNAKFKNSDGRVTTSGVGALQKGVFKESGGGTHFLGCGGSDSGAAERISALENENSQLKHQLKQVEERAQASEVKANELLDALNAVEHQLSEQTKLLSVRSEEVKKQEECFSHVLQHIQQGSWIKSTLPAQQTEPSNKCVMKEVSVTLERHDITFHEQFCCLCPFDKIVKMEIEKRFGIDENHQVVSVSAVGAHEQAEVPCSSTSTLSQSLSVRESEECKLQVKVRLTPILDIQEKHLIMSSSLGSGSYGTVFKSKHIPSSTDVAVKTLHDAIAEKYSVDRFRLEAEIVSGLRHPNIVKCIGTCNSSVGKLMLVSELMCCSLRQLLRQKNLKFQEAVAIALGIAKGMDALHRQNYMHRDLSSNNILLDANGTPKICDFGVSRAMKSQCLQASIITKVPGTLVYMSPQMFTDHYSLKGDVWSFGILTTEMINGEFVDSACHTLTLAQQLAVLDEKKKLLPPLDVQEVNDLCRKATETTVICCLDRRESSLSTVNTLVHSANSPYFFADLDIGALGTAPDLLFLVVQSCLSICEKNRAPFTVIVQILQCCCTSAAIALSASSSSDVPPGNVTQDQVKESISRWLSFIAPTTFPASSPAQPSHCAVINIKETDLRISSVELGRGTYGAVFSGKLIPTSKDVAVKTLHDLMMTDNNAERLRLEAEIMSEIKHPNIVKCLGMCTTTSGKLLLVSELMCCTLKQLLHKKPLKFQEVIGIGLSLAKGMECLHKQNYMHGDLNSSNILFDKDGTPKICDFISATKCIQPAETRNEHPGVAVYMSPQMFTRHFSQKGDLWSFGIVTTEMISGNAVDVTLHSDPETFLNEQKRKLTPDDAEEVDKLCREASKDAVMCCLNRRDEFLHTVDTIIHSADSPLFSVVPPRSDLTAASIISALGTAPDRLFSIVQTCLSICESNRQSFTAIVETLQGCCTTTAVTLSSSSSSPECIAQWLSSLGPLCRS